MADYNKFTDHELASLLKEDDHLAYNLIFERYAGVLVAHAYRVLANQDIANDVTQDVFLALWENRHHFKLTTSLTSYLFTAVRNRVINNIAHQKVIDKYADSIVNFMDNHYPAADEQLMAKELSELIDKEIATLPSKMRNVFLLNKNEELSYKEIGQKLNISDQTAKQQVYNALKYLRLKLHMLFLL
ncbi:MAG: sigW 11 [Mucilaginibacter sp.]|nr:sigW 11 [Mucilaginibacter sp.]